MTETPLDIAFARMEANPDDDKARLAFYERVAGSELFLLLTKDPDGDQVDPQVFETDDGTFVLAFDRETRLTDFTGAPAPYAALSGRSLAKILAAQHLGIGLNLGVAPSSFLLPDTAVAWLSVTLDTEPDEVEARPSELFPPKGLPDALITALDQKLATATGLARFAYLVAAQYADRRMTHILAFIDPVPGAEPALAQAASEALIFSGIEAGEMDVAFFSASDTMSAKLAKVGLRFDLPEPEASVAPGAPGMDPNAPPRLK